MSFLLWIRPTKVSVGQTYKYCETWRERLLVSQFILWYFLIRWRRRWWFFHEYCACILSAFSTLTCDVKMLIRQESIYNSHSHIISIRSVCVKYFACGSTACIFCWNLESKIWFSFDRKLFIIHTATSDDDGFFNFNQPTGDGRFWRIILSDS